MIDFKVRTKVDEYKVDRGVYSLTIWENMTKDIPQPIKFIVFIGELDQNPGKSVTNAIEYIAAKVWADYFYGKGIEPDAVRWIEFYHDGEVIRQSLVKLDSWIIQPHDSANGLPSPRMMFGNPHWQDLPSSQAILENSPEVKP